MSALKPGTIMIRWALSEMMDRWSQTIKRSGMAAKFADRLSRLFRRPLPAAGLRLRKILLVRCCCLGDALMTTPAVAAIARRWPEAEVHYLTSRWSRPAIENNPHVKRIIDAGSVGSGPYSLVDYLRLAIRLRSSRYDAAFVFERSLWLNLLPALAGVPLRFGIDSGGRGFSLSAATRPLPNEHESALFRRIAGLAGADESPGRPEFFPSAEATGFAKKLLIERELTAGGFIALHPGGGANPGAVLARKRWPAERYAELADRLNEAAWKVVLIGSPDEQELNRRVELLAASRPVNLTSRLGFDHLGALLAQAALFIGNDSGTAHLAAAVGCKPLVLFGPTNPHLYGPPDDIGRYLWSKPHCSPCFHDGVVDPCRAFICMPAIKVEQVFDAAMDMLTKEGVSAGAIRPDQDV